MAEQRTIKLTNNSSGFLHHLNYPRELPQNMDFVQHLVVPLGEVISLELHGVVLSADNCRDYEDGDEDGGDNSEEPLDDDAGYGDSVNSGNGRQRVTAARVAKRGSSRGLDNGSNNLLEIYDNYADVNGTKWILCAKRDQKRRHHHARGRPQPGPSRASGAGQRHGLNTMDGNAGDSDDDGSSPVFITSYLNTLHIRQRSLSSTSAALNQRGLSLFARLNATVKVYEDKGYRPKLASKDVWVESCDPNPCQYGGKCVDTKGMKHCACLGHSSGRFCGLTICDFDPCLYGTCELTETSFKCNCMAGYVGSTCEEKVKPCAENPCHGRGECFEKNNGFYCR